MVRIEFTFRNQYGLIDEHGECEARAAFDSDQRSEYRENNRQHLQLKREELFQHTSACDERGRDKRVAKESVDKLEAGVGQR